MNLNVTGGAESVDVSESTFARQYNEALVHQVVVAYLADARQGTRAQKTRSEVNGGGRKPYRQKGTGRARAGTIRSPIWRGGGNAFPAKPADFGQKVNKKMYRGAMQSILSELIRQERLVLVDDFSIDEPRTKVAVTKLKELELDNVLIVVESVDDNLALATRNLKNVEVTDVKGMNPVSLIGFEKVLFSVGALKQAEELLG